MTTSERVEQIRILQCFTCKSMDEMSDYEGPPEFDHVLHHVDDRHGGHSAEPHERTILKVEKKYWEDREVRKQIVAQMWANTRGFVPEYYHAKNTLQEDAGKCFVAHRRSVPCIDYQDRSKRIGNPAAQLRKELSRETRRDFTQGGPKLYLCNFCPVQNHVDRMKLQMDATHQF